MRCHKRSKTDKSQADNPNQKLDTVKRFCDSRRIHYLTREFHVKFHLKNRYRTHHFAIRAISVFCVKFNVEFPRQVMDFPIVVGTIASAIAQQ